MTTESRTPQSAGVSQAKTLREQARKGGLRFEAYIPSGLAEWVLDVIEREVFAIPPKPCS